MHPAAGPGGARAVASREPVNEWNGDFTTVMPRDPRCQNAIPNH
jgi:hypothetical protein